MDRNDIKLDSLRRIAQRLREIKNDNFAEGLANRLEAEITRHRVEIRAAASKEGVTTASDQPR